MTVWRMKLHTGGIPSKTGPRAKLHSTTMVTLTRLLAMRMVASSRSGFASNSRTVAPAEVSSRSSHCCSLREKKEISLPDTNPEMMRHPRARIRAMAPAMVNELPVAAPAAVSNMC